MMTEEQLVAEFVAWLREKDERWSAFIRHGLDLETVILCYYPRDNDDD